MDTIDGLIQSLKSGERTTQLNAIRTLRKHPERRVLWALTECFSADDDVCLAAIDAIGQFDHDVIKHSFAPVLVDRDRVAPSPMRCMAAMFLAYAFNDSEAMGLLIAVSKRDPDEKVRAAAGRAVTRAMTFKAEEMRRT